MVNGPKKIGYYVIVATLIIAACVWTIYSMSTPYYKSFFKFHEKNENKTYILLWTSPNTLPFAYLNTRDEKFVADNCSKQDCFITSDKSYFSSLTLFDVLLFHGPELVTNEYIEYPDRRSSAQMYIFASMESSEYYPICNARFDNYFNRTWTYELSSDILFNYITIRDKSWHIIGPKKNMHWIDFDEMKNTNLDEKIKNKLKSKSKAVAWFVSNCKPLSERNILAENLGTELNKYGLVFDVYGGCGKLKCSVDNPRKCDGMVQEDYYFYLAFENSGASDYVTEKLLRALNNYAIPVVYGGANYSSFMPEGTYLDAGKHDAKVLAKQIKDLIQNKTRYYEYFKWHNYYTYHDPKEYPDSNPYCSLCAKVTDERWTWTKQVYHKFRDWWNDNRKC